MGYDLQQRLSTLKTQVDGDPTGKLSLLRALLQGVVLLGLLALLLSAISPAVRLDDEELRQAIEHSSGQLGRRGRSAELSSSERWALQLKAAVEDRTQWLSKSWLGEDSAARYLSFASSLFSTFARILPSAEEEQLAFYEHWGISLSQIFVDSVLRLGFVVTAFWPLWFLGALAGFILVRLSMNRKPIMDILSVCTRPGRLFYSGIFGPLRPNASGSGTDLSCPSLACPDRAKRALALRSPLFQLLREFGAVNNTNIELIQIILAYRQFPSFVEEERVVEEETDATSESSRMPAIFVPIREVGNLTLEHNSVDGLRAVLLAHRLLVAHGELRAQSPGAVMEDGYLAHIRTLRESLSTLPPLAQTLLVSLVPSRSQAASALSSQLVATAYLAIEAGKALVFRREGEAFIQVSRLPHLQARAVVQSIIPFHREYNGDQRMVIRQAIISARRHGDFGRAFLPVNMSVASRALRDWLEVLYTHPAKRGDAAALTELDAHLEEVVSNWRAELARRLEGERNVQYAPHDERLLLWKGIVYKSVVLIPLANFIEIALYGFSPGRLARVSELLRTTQRLQASLSISARLPGFKRQAEEVEIGSGELGSTTLAQIIPDPKLLETWFLLRRMLTRYNWLSTRIGDDAVPAQGLVQAILIHRPTEGDPKVIGIDALVPIRHRRFDELLGPNWERTFYQNTVNHRDIDVFVDLGEFRTALVERKELEKHGHLPLTSATGGG